MVGKEMREEIKERLARAHGIRLRGVILYGSEARDEARTDSDIDLLVLLDKPVVYGHDLDTSLEAVYPLSVQINRRISPKPIPADDFDTIDCPLYRRARQEGIKL